MFHISDCSVRFNRGQLPVEFPNTNSVITGMHVAHPPVVDLTHRKLFMVSTEMEVTSSIVVAGQEMNYGGKCCSGW